MYEIKDLSSKNLIRQIIKDIIKTDFLPTVEKNKKSVQLQATKGLKTAFSKNNFSRNPIDTGQSQRKSHVKIKIHPESASLFSQLVVFGQMDSYTPTKQRKFYENGWGPNEKYGLRNPRKYHANNEGSKLLKKLVKK